MIHPNADCVSNFRFFGAGALCTHKWNEPVSKLFFPSIAIRENS
jgi:hypothetical protein